MHFEAKKVIDNFDTECNVEFDLKKAQKLKSDLERFRGFILSLDLKNFPEKFLTFCITYYEDKAKKLQIESSPSSNCKRLRSQK